MSNSRVVIVQDYVPEYRVPFFNLLGEELNRRNITLEVILDKKINILNRNGDSSTISPQTLFLDSLSLKAGKTQVRFRKISRNEISADLLIVEQAAKNVSTWVIIFIRKLLRKPTALWGHGIDYVNIGGPISRGLRRYMINLSSHVLVYTSGAAQRLILEGVPSDKITSVQNSTDTLALKRNLKLITDDQRKNFIHSFDLSENLVLFLGSLDVNKNLDLLFSATQVAHEADPSLTLAIVGEGPLRKYVEEAASRQTWIRFLGRSDEAKLMALASCKAIVIPGRVGLVAADALASGLPVVTVRSALHAPEFHYLNENTTCMLSEATPISLASKIIEAISTDFQTLSRREALLESDKYSIEKMTKNFVHGITKTLGLRDV